VKWSVAVLAVLVVALAGMLLFTMTRQPAPSAPIPAAQPSLPTTEKPGDEPIVAMPDPAPPTTIGPAVDRKAPPPPHPPVAPVATVKRPSTPRPPKVADSLTADQRKLAALYAEGGGEASSPKEAPAVDRSARASTQVSESAIREVVTKNLRGLNACYERVLRHDQTLKHARLMTHLKIGVSGMVTRVSMGESELASSEIGQCITQTIKRWRFPSADAEYETEFPIILQAD
jgi:hypothetical protein